MALEEVGRGLLGHVEEGVELDRSVDRPVDGEERFLALVTAGDVPVELRVLVGVDLGLGQRPDSLGAIGQLPAHVDGELHEVGVLLDDVLDPPLLRELQALLLEVEDDLRAGVSRSPTPTVNEPVPVERQTTGSAPGSIDRVRTSTRSATMKAA